MNFTLSPEEALIQTTAREFAEKELAPIAGSIDKKGEIPRAVLDKMAALGFLGMLTPESFGLAPRPSGAIAGGGPEENRARLTDVLSGTPGPWRDAVVANAGAALWVAGLAADVLEGARLAAATIDSGAAARALERLVEVSRRHAAGAQSGS